MMTLNDVYPSVLPIARAIVAINQIGRSKKRSDSSPPPPPGLCCRRDYSRLDTLLKRRLVGGAYPSGGRSRSDVSPAHIARDRSVLLSPPDGFRLGKHTDVARAAWLAGLTDYLGTSITGLSRGHARARSGRAASLCVCSP